ncbi:PEMT-domain-containing protein [Wallemia mellicola]|uniref:Phosphatidyl-N-methylethanolamine N-methyltransferase n=1 Tax=Wallemia mellicola TaxID=1708541 RepID=A0A4V4MMU4_9BASI|nr:PEMT-domain-containing protein [Wallemia mellicola]TIC04793.1 PEMT-domain-containing protein [Wallemia mellicola]TIC11962.1 PEMT-domain-containing protein [Wallemia mellicola]TIC32731.1 PEMT-domain-containing protein [Wallemia mellicola]TIC55855.1 PEMT-domain-containing protein [Wallemia mellicola]
MVAKQHPFIRGLSELVPHPSPLLSVSQDKPEDWFDFKQPSLWIVIASIVFNPLFWNILLTKLAGGRPYLGCYLLAVTIFSLGILRDHLFQSALAEQPNLAPHPYYPTAHVYVALALFLSGQILVITSMLALGVTGTYLGDYFGILMSHRVTSFPFNVVEDPMYIGSTLCFFGTSIWYRSPAGIAISVFVFIVYQIALRYEGPFTAMIYSAKDKKTEEATPKAAPVKAPVEPVESSPNNSPAYRTRSRARKVIDE